MSVLLLFFSGCSMNSGFSSSKSELASSSLSSCSLDQVLSAQCITNVGQITTATMGSHVTSWSNASATTTVSGLIADGYYQSKQCNFTDTDLVAANILTGVNIFGVAGAAVSAYADCTDQALNTARCSTQTNRYVYTDSYGGRSANCSAGLNATACWTNSASQYMTSTAGISVSGSDGSLSVTIPAGYYSGAQTATMSDADLVAANIRSGVNIFGVAGSYSSSGTFVQNMASIQHRDKSFSQATMQTEFVTGSGTSYTNSSSGYRAVPSILKDDDGYFGTSYTAVDRTGWGSTTCGTSQATIDLRIADCATVFGAEATWDGAVKGNAGQSVWHLVSRTGDLSGVSGQEVWRDDRTKALWSSKVATAANWCRASGSNFITNNPVAENDPNDFCDNATYQNTGVGPAVKAVSACFEDGDNFFTTSHASINNAGKAGLSLASTPSVSWRLPSIHDYHMAEVDGIRFVLPDMLGSGDYEWSTSIISDNRDQAWAFGARYGEVYFLYRSVGYGTRCIGR